MDLREISRTLADSRSRHRPRASRVTVAVAGEIDLATSPDMVATLLAASKPETAGIVIDASAVSFFSAAGIGAFVRARDHESEPCRDLLVRAPPRVVTRVPDICDLADLVEPPATAEPTSVPVASDRSDR